MRTCAYCPSPVGHAKRLCDPCRVERQRGVNNAAREKTRAAGKCTRCGSLRDARGTAYYCRACADLRNAYNRSWKAARVAEGLCASCTNSRDDSPSTRYCARCLELRVEDQRTRYWLNVGLKESGPRALGQAR